LKKNLAEEISMRNFLFLSGPTASGKTRLAIELAKKFGAVIFNCDSIQVYHELNIGAAKPSPQERSEVPHFLFDVMSAPDVMTAGKYRKFFLNELENIPETQLIIVVGGTGFYYRALEKGLFDISETPVEIKEALNEELKSNGGKTDLFWQEILNRDPEYAGKIHPNDEYRILRAIEILRQNPDTNVTLLNQGKINDSESTTIGRILKLHLQLEPSLLNQRIEQRVKQMFDNGMIEEVESLLGKGLKTWSPLSSVGYFEVCQYLLGHENRLGLEERILISTRQLAKKQRTWFKKEPDLIALDATEPGSLKTKAEAHLASFLSNM